MKPNQRYEDWKKEFCIWKETNTALAVERRIQAGILFESLDGLPRQTVLSELTVEEITSDNGVKNILDTLDNYFMGNAIQNAFNSIEDLMGYKCKPDMTIQNFIIEFRLLVNKV